MDLLAPTMKKTTICSFFFTVLMFSFVESCVGTFALGIAASCNAQFYLLYTALFFIVSYLGACMLVSYYEKIGETRGSGRIHKARR
ncbi:MAG: hypothetical protein HYY37_07080 [Candidatus Aenigmarchaeota archaeon]|nr:hypothetical protein [Candidatus Aenigmarchaeota archaeon]